MMLTFTFTLNQETSELVFHGNIEPQVALNIIQQIVISEAIRRSKDGRDKQPGRTVEETGAAISPDKAGEDNP